MGLTDPGRSLDSPSVPKGFSNPVIRLRGVRQNNLKGFDLDLPTRRLIVITGLSGSGKSSLAFDTLFAEGQRRYIETFSPYARQFFDRMDKPRVDSVEGIPPAIAVEQRNAVRTTRSTVGTMTEICDYLKVVWPHVAVLHCRGCGRPVRKDTPQSIWQLLNAECGLRNADCGFSKAEGGRPNAEGGPGDMEPGPATSHLAPRTSHLDPRHSPLVTRNSECLITFDLPLSDKLSLDESLALVARQGYQRLWIEGEPVRLEDALQRLSSPTSDFRPPASDLRRPASGRRHLTVIQDRVKLVASSRARFAEACEQAYHFGKGKLSVHLREGTDWRVRRFSNLRHCAECDLEYAEPTPALFSFNHPLGACPTCKGFGRIISIDYRRAIPDRSLTLAQGAVKPWRTGFSAECQDDLRKFCRAQGIRMDVPFRDLPREQQDWVMLGDPDYGTDEEHEWPRAWYGVKGYFRWLESRAYKMHVRVLLSRYRAYTPCPDCGGRRLRPEALLYRVPIALSPSDGERVGVRGSFGGSGSDDGPSASRVPRSSLSLAEFYQLTIEQAFEVVQTLARTHRAGVADPLAVALAEVRSRLGYLVEVGLGYLTLDRPTRSLSGGETERVNLTTCLGTKLVNTLYVLDEPSVGLHPRDTQRLIRILEALRDLGNTVVVVEHEPSVILAADQVVDLGPGHGESGGELVFQGSPEAIVRSKASLTGQYLGGRRGIEPGARRTVRFEAGSAPASELGTGAALTLSGARLNNLKDLTVRFPLNRFVCLTGVSGSGKTTLACEVLYPLLAARLQSGSATAGGADPAPPGVGGGAGLSSTLRPGNQADARRRGEDTRALPAPDRLDRDNTSNGDAAGLEPTSEASLSSTSLTGWERLGQVVMVDQSPLGKTPRSNPAVYLGAFDDIRELFAQSEPARQRGLNASAFSFNSTQGQCERCRGAGFEKIEMQFLSDVFIRCPDCGGRRYRPHILEVELPAPQGRPAPPKPTRSSRRLRRRENVDRRAARRGWSIADMLDATVDEAVGFLSMPGEVRAAQRAVDRLRLLQEVGLGYLRLGQPINTLSGGESQRLKLVGHLADADPEPAADLGPGHQWRGGARRSGSNAGTPVSAGVRASGRPTLFLFDEPTTGLHFDDVRRLLVVFHRLVEAGHSVLVIEHNLDVIASADWVIDLGPEAGEAGGRVVAEGPPEAIAACAGSHTGEALRLGLSGLRIRRGR